MPRRSTAFATRSARCVNTRFTRRANVVSPCACASSRGAARRAVAYLTSRARGLRLLCLSATRRTGGGARGAARIAPSATSSSASTSSRSGAGRRGTTSSAPATPPGWARAAGAGLKSALERAGGYGGDFATVLASLRRANRADVVFSTVDTVGIPLMLLQAAGRVRPPLVYVAIGLPERLARLRSERMRRLYARALASWLPSLAYSEHEAAELRRWLESHGESTRVEFVPFGVDERAFAPSLEQPAVDVVSVGADPHRDVELLLAVAAEMPSRSFRIVTTRDRARALGVAAGERRDRDRPPVRRRCGAGSRRRASSRSPCSRTATRARPRCCSRRWRSPSRSSYRGRRRSRAATASSTARTAGSSSPGDAERSSARWATCSETSGTRARSARRARATVEASSPGIATSIGSRRSSRDSRRVALRPAAAYVSWIVASCARAHRNRARRPGVRHRPGVPTWGTALEQRPGRLPEHRGAHAGRRPPLRGRDRQQGSALLLRARGRALDRRLEGACCARRHLARAAALSFALLCASSSAARAVVAGFLMYPLALTASWYEPGLTMLGGLALAPLVGWLWLAGSFAPPGRRSPSCALQDHGRGSWPSLRCGSAAVGRPSGSRLRHVDPSSGGSCRRRRRVAVAFLAVRGELGATSRCSRSTSAIRMRSPRPQGAPADVASHFAVIREFFLQSGTMAVAARACSLVVLVGAAVARVAQGRAGIQGSRRRRRDDARGARHARPHRDLDSITCRCWRYPAALIAMVLIVATATIARTRPGIAVAAVLVAFALWASASTRRMAGSGRRGGEREQRRRGSARAARDALPPAGDRVPYMVFGSNSENAHAVFIDGAFDLECRWFHLYPNNVRGALRRDARLRGGEEAGARARDARLLRAARRTSRHGRASSRARACFLESEYVKVADQDMFQVWKREAPTDSARCATRDRCAVGRLFSVGSTELDWRRSRRGERDLALFHEFEPPPAGGGHQFLRALVHELESRGLDGRAEPDLGSDARLSVQLLQLRLRATTPVRSPRLPDGAPRRRPDRRVSRIRRWNRRADRGDQRASSRTRPSLQSRYSLEKHGELGIELRDPVVISNAVDPAIFHPPNAREPLGGRPLRVIASSWSQNPRKGAERSRGSTATSTRSASSSRSSGSRRSRSSASGTIGPLTRTASRELLREHDVYLAASRDDPCSNALLEALACGLPAVVSRQRRTPGARRATAACRSASRGGSRRYSSDSSPRLDGYRAGIVVPSITEVADRYLEVLGRRRGASLESRPVPNYAHAPSRRCASVSTVARPRRRLARARRPLRVGRVDAGDAGSARRR